MKVSTPGALTPDHAVWVPGGAGRDDNFSARPPENRRTYPHMGGAELDRNRKIGAHIPIDRFFSPVARGRSFAVSAKCGAGASLTGGMHIRAGNRQAVFVAAGRDEGVGVGKGATPALLRLLTGIELDETVSGRRFFCKSISLANRLANARAIDRVEWRRTSGATCLLRLVGLQRPDQVAARCPGKPPLNPWPLRFWLPAREFFAEYALPGHDGRRDCPGIEGFGYPRSTSTEARLPAAASLQARTMSCSHRGEARLGEGRSYRRGGLAAPCHPGDRKFYPGWFQFYLPNSGKAFLKPFPLPFECGGSGDIRCHASVSNRKRVKLKQPSRNPGARLALLALILVDALDAGTRPRSLEDYPRQANRGQQQKNSRTHRAAQRPRLQREVVLFPSRR